MAHSLQRLFAAGIAGKVMQRILFHKRLRQIFLKSSLQYKYLEMAVELLVSEGLKHVWAKLRRVA